MGVSANLIAKHLAVDGRLFCVDPFLDRKGQKDPGWSMAERDLRRNKLLHKVIFLRGFSADPAVKAQIPSGLDFIFVDGDHSFEGSANDWEIVRDKLAVDGIVCLHDTIIPPAEPFRNFGSVTHFRDIVSFDTAFQLIDQCYSMTVLRRINSAAARHQ